MSPRDMGGFAFISDKEKTAEIPDLANAKNTCSDDTAELPDIKSIIDTEFTVEEDITYIHTNERI